jgi:hypothetical protein
MRSLFVSLFLFSLPFAGITLAGEKKTGDGRTALDKAVRTSATLKSYAFQIEEHPGQGTGGTFQGKYEQGKPTFFLVDKIEFFKKGNVLAYKDGEKWELSRTGTLSDPLRVLGAAAKVRGARLPHEELLELAKGMTQVKKVEAEPSSTVYLGVFQGELKEAHARRLVPKSLEQVARTGQARIWVGADGQVHKYSMTIRVQGRLGNAEIDGQVTRTVALTDRGTAKIVVPDGANKALAK